MLWDAREMLKGKPVKFGPGHRVTAACYGSIGKDKKIKPARCYEIHLIGTLNAANVFRGDVAIGGPDWPASVYAEWNIHENRYDRVWAFFQGLLGDSDTVDLTEALS